MSTDMTDRQQEQDHEEVQTTGHLGLKIVGVLVVVIAALVLATIAVRGQELPEDPQVLVSLLASDQTETARRAGEELVRKPRTALPPLQKAITADGARELLKEQGLQPTDENVQQLRINAIGVMVDIRTSQALAEISPLVTDPNKDVQIAAIDAVSKLAFLWREEAASALARAFESDDLQVVEKAGAGLQNMDFPGATEVLRNEFQAGEGVQAVMAARMLYEEEENEEAAAFLIQAVSSEDEQVATAARESVKKLGPELAPQLVEARGPAAEALLDELRDDVIIPALQSTLDARKAADLLEALGHIADRESVEVMQESFTNSKNESRWRIAAAEAMAMAARRNADVEPTVVETLDRMLNNEGETDDRIKIGAAIALARLGKEQGVDHLLQELDQFQADIAKETDRTKIQDLHALRIRAQEALAEAGQYEASRAMIVQKLMARAQGFENRLPELRAEIERTSRELADARGAENPDTAVIEEKQEKLAELRAERAGGYIILWAASETLGVLQVEEFVPNLGKYLTATHEPRARFVEDGSLQASGSGAEAPSLVLENWREPSDEAVQEQLAKVRLFDYSASVRKSAAVALDRIGGDRAVEFMEQGRQQHEDLVQRLEANRLVADYFRRAAVIDTFQAELESVLFYLRSALRRREDV